MKKEIRYLIWAYEDGEITFDELVSYIMELHCNEVEELLGKV